MSLFRLSLGDAHEGKASQVIVDRRYPNPKVKLNQTPAHIGILKLDIVSGPTYSSGDIITWGSFPHGYDYMPTVVGLFIDGLSGFDDGGILPYSGIGSLGQIFLDADERNINVKFESFDLFGTPLPARHLRIRYYVFAEEGHVDP